MSMIGNGRVLRVCDLCGGVDDHPRHVIAGTLPKNLVTGQSGDAAGTFPRVSDDILNKVIEAAPAEERGRLVNELMDTSSSDRHLDCCAADGCPNNTCGPLVAGAKGKTGKAMLNHLTGLDDLFADRSDVVKGE